MRDCDAHGGRELERDLGRSIAGPQAIGAPDVRGEIAVAEPEPLDLAQRLEPIHHGPALAAEAPSPDLVVQAGQRVRDGVVVRPDRQAVQLQVVAGVDDDRQIGPDGRGQAVCHLGPTDAAREQDHPHDA